MYVTIDGYNYDRCSECRFDPMLIWLMDRIGYEIHFGNDSKVELFRLFFAIHNYKVKHIAQVGDCWIFNPICWILNPTLGLYVK